MANEEIRGIVGMLCTLSLIIRTILDGIHRRSDLALKR